MMVSRPEAMLRSVAVTPSLSASRPSARASMAATIKADNRYTGLLPLGAPFSTKVNVPADLGIAARGDAAAFSLNRWRISAFLGLVWREIRCDRDPESAGDNHDSATQPLERPSGLRITDGTQESAETSSTLQEMVPIRTGPFQIFFGSPPEPSILLVPEKGFEPPTN